MGLRRAHLLRTERRPASTARLERPDLALSQPQDKTANGVKMPNVQEVNYNLPETGVAKVPPFAVQARSDGFLARSVGSVPPTAAALRAAARVPQAGGLKKKIQRRQSRVCTGPRDPRPLMPLLLVLGLAQALPQNHPAALTAAGAAVLQSSEPGESGGANSTVKLSTKTKICSDCSAAVTAVKTYLQNHIDNHASGSTEADNIAYFKQKSVSEWSTDCARDVLDDGATATDCNYIFSQILDQGDLTFMTVPNDEICTALTSYPCSPSSSDASVKFRAMVRPG